VADYICTVCGWEGPLKRRKRGSKGVEFFLWTVLLVPGPFYSLWRRIGVEKACPNCKIPKLAKLNSVAGVLAQRKFDIELGIIKSKAQENKMVEQHVAPAFESKNKPVDPEQW